MDEQNLKESLLALIQNDADIRNALLQLKPETQSPAAPPQTDSMQEEQIHKLEKQVDALCASLREKHRLYTEAQTEIEKLKNTRLEYEKQIDVFAAEMKEMQQRISMYQDAAVKQSFTMERTTEELERYQTQFGTPMQSYTKYWQLSDTIRQQFNGLIDASSAVAFLVTGSEERNIPQIFDHICEEWEKYNASTLEMLNAVFDVLFKVFQVRHPDYRRIETAEGESYDASKHMSTSAGTQSGVISRVIVRGFENQSGSVRKKSLVTVR